MSITTIDSDIGRINQYVKLLVQSLTARNQQTSDLLINLFKGYGAVSDEVLRGWLLRKQDDHEEGEEITPDELMQAAKDKYDTMVEKGTWNAPTAKEKIVALEAKLESTVKSLNEKVLTDELSKKGKGNRPSGGDKKSKKDSAKSGDHPTKWPKPTKANNEKMGKFKGHMWYWCGKDTGEKCECWRAHKPKECKGLMPATDSAEGKRKTSEVESNRKKSIAKKKLKVAKAYVAEIEKQAAMESETDDDLD